MTTATTKLRDWARRIVAAGAEVARLRDVLTDPKVKVVLNVAAARLTPNVGRLTLAWIRDFLADESDRAVCASFDCRGKWLREVGREVSELYETYHDWQ